MDFHKQLANKQLTDKQRAMYSEMSELIRNAFPNVAFSLNDAPVEIQQTGQMYVPTVSRKHGATAIDVAAAVQFLTTIQQRYANWDSDNNI